MPHNLVYLENTPHIITSKQLSYRHINGMSFRFPDIGLRAKEDLLIFGNASSGKTTLLHLLSGILKIQSGSVTINHQRIARFSEKEMDRFRGKNIGLIMQSSVFIQSLNVLENILAAQYFSMGKSDRSRAIELLSALGLSAKLKKSPLTLSAAVQKRIAIVRALVSNPCIVLADQPTLGLDFVQAQEVCEFLRKETSKIGAALIVASHDERLKSVFSNVMDL